MMTKNVILLFLAAYILSFAACKPSTYPATHLSISDSLFVDKGVKVKMTYYDGNKEVSAKGRIQKRGGMSMKYEKLSYKIEFNKRLSLHGWTKDDDYILFASSIDKTFMRNALSYQLFREMSDENIAPQTSYTELYVNKEYSGLYIWMEQLESTRLGIHKSDPLAYVFKEPPVFRLDTIIPQYPDNYFQQTYPNKDKSSGFQMMQTIRERLLTDSDSAIATWVPRDFDLRNIADWHILLLLTNNGDGVVKNFYLYKQNAASPFRVAPWDFDHSFGRDGDNECNMLFTIVEPERNLLISRLMQQKEYKDLLQERWGHFRQTIITQDHLFSMVDEYTSQLATAVNKNSTLWPNDIWWYTDDNDFITEVDVMKSYIQLRIPQLDIYFSGI